MKDIIKTIDNYINTAKKCIMKGGPYGTASVHMGYIDKLQKLKKMCEKKLEETEQLGGSANENL